MEFETVERGGSGEAPSVYTRPGRGSTTLRMKSMMLATLRVKPTEGEYYATREVHGFQRKKEERKAGSYF